MDVTAWAQASSVESTSNRSFASISSVAWSSGALSIHPAGLVNVHSIYAGNIASINSDLRLGFCAVPTSNSPDSAAVSW